MSHFFYTTFLNLVTGQAEEKNIQLELLPFFFFRDFSDSECVDSDVNERLKTACYEGTQKLLVMHDVGWKHLVNSISTILCVVFPQVLEPV